MYNKYRNNFNIVLFLYINLFSSAALYLLYLGSINSSYVDFFSQSSTISLVSLFYFLNLIIASSFSKTIWIKILPLVILTVPNAINDLIPAFYLDDVLKPSSPSFSIITHIDLYLLLGLRYVKSNQTKHNCSVFKLKTVFLLTFLTLFSNAIGFMYHVENPYFLFFNLTQLRYLLLISLLTPLLETHNGSDFRNWLIISLFLVLLESIIFTTVFQYTNLTSGNFGTNTLAILLSMLILWICLTSKYPKIWSCTVAIFLVLLISILTDTRAAAAAVTLTFIVYGFLTSQRSSKIAILLVIAPLIIIVVSKLGGEIAGGFSFLTRAFDTYENAGQSVEITENSSSIVTRLSMWFSAWNMLKEYPLGTGYSGWHYLSDGYGVTFTMFIDPHNDYFFSLINFGVLASAVYFYVIYISPFKKYSKSNMQYFLIPIIFVMFANLTNSNLYKHQFFVLFLILLASSFFSNYRNFFIKSNSSETDDSAFERMSFVDKDSKRPI